GNSSATAADWIGLFAAGAPNDRASRLDAFYLSCTFSAYPSSPSTSGSCVSSAATSNGTYEFRFFANDSWTLKATSTAFTIAAGPTTTPTNTPTTGPTATPSLPPTSSPGLSLDASPTSTTPGAPVTITWSGNTSAT